MEQRTTKKQVSAKSCFWGHQWSKWEQFDVDAFRIDTTTNVRVDYIKIKQRRICEKCNKMQVADV